MGQQISIVFIINFLILIAPFVDFVLFFSRWNIFLIFFLSFGSVLLITSYPLMILLYKSWIDSLPSFICLFEFSKSSLRHFFQQFNSRVTFSFQYWRIRSLWRCFSGLSFCGCVSVVLCASGQQACLPGFPLIFYFCFTCFILCEPSQWAACTWVYALYHYLQGKLIYQIVRFKGATSSYL